MRTSHNFMPVVTALTVMTLAVSPSTALLTTQCRACHSDKFSSEAATVARAESPSKTSGVIVERAPADSRAGKAGLEEGDEIVIYDDTLLQSTFAFQAAEENTFGRDQIVIQVDRAGASLTLRVPQGELGAQVRPRFSASIGRLHEEARALKEGGHTDEAILKWKEAGNAALGENNDAAAWFFFRAGAEYESQSQWTRAGEAYFTTWQLLSGGQDAAGQSRALAALGRCNQSREEFGRAQDWFEKARTIDSAVGRELWLGDDFYSLGRVAHSLGLLSLAQEHHIRALSIRERLVPGSLRVAQSLNSLGAVADSRGDLEAAKDYFRRGLEIRERVAPDSVDVAGSLNNLGHIARSQGDLKTSQDYLLRALVLYEKLSPNSLAVSAALTNLGIAAREQGDLESAEDYFSRAYEIRKRVAPDSLAVASGLGNLALIASERGDIDSAENNYNRALNIFERLAPNTIEMATTLQNLGNTMRERGDFQRAEEYDTRALKLSEQLAPNSLDVAVVLSSLGSIARERGLFEKADDYFNRALRMRERLAPNSLLVADSFNRLGILASNRRDWVKANEFHHRALSIRENLAPKSLETAESLTELGTIAFLDGESHDSLAFFSRAVAIIETQRSKIVSADVRALLLAKEKEAYEGLIRVQVAHGDLAGALSTSERARARSLLDLLAESHADIRSDTDEELLKRERFLRQLLNGKALRQRELLNSVHTVSQADAAAAEIDSITTDYNEVQAKIRSTNPRYAALTQPQPLSIQEIRTQILDTRTVLLEFALGKEESYLFVVEDQLIKGYILPPRSEIEAIARQAYALAASRHRPKNDQATLQQKRIADHDASFSEVTFRLAQMLLAPAAEQLRGKRFLIVPDGPLLQVPFAALPDPTASQPQPLIVAHEVVVLPSASVLGVLRHESRGRRSVVKQLVVFADPVFEQDDPRVTSQTEPNLIRSDLTSRNHSAQSSVARDSTPATRDFDRAAGEADILDSTLRIRRLPFSREEATRIFSFANRDVSVEQLDFNASRATVLASDLGKFRILHFATHALLNNDHPALSGIVLSLIDHDGRPADGFLRLNDIYNLNLPVELVVLSACQTALGKEIKGEGLIGLTRGFMYAGASRVIASLWKVDDEATSELMGRLYEKMLRQGQSPASALRQAQLEMSRQKRWQEPYFWAGFELQGEWK